MNSTKTRPKQYMHCLEKENTSHIKDHTLGLTKGLVEPPHHSEDVDHYPSPLKKNVSAKQTYLDIWQLVLPQNYLYFPR